MRKILPLLLTAFFVASCSNDNDIEQEAIDPTIEEIWTSLDGSYKATYYYYNTDTEWYSETIEFHPYSEPKEITPIVILFPEFTAYGTAIITNTRFSNITGSTNCYYSINVAYTGATPTISFFEYGDNGEVRDAEDKRNIKNWSNSQFSMWNYGLSENENATTYYKQ